MPLGLTDSEVVSTLIISEGNNYAFFDKMAGNIYHGGDQASWVVP